MRYHLIARRAPHHEIVDRRQVHQKIVAQVRIIAQKSHDIAPGGALHNQRIVPVCGGLRQNGCAKALLQPDAGNRCIAHQSLISMRLIPLQGATLPGIEEANRQDYQEGQHGHQPG